MIRPRMRVKHHAEAPHVEESRCRIGPRGPQKHMVGLVLAQHVVDEIGRDRDLPAGLLLARKAALDQPGDDRAMPEGALHQGGFGEPVLEIVAEHVLGEQVVEEAGLAADAGRDVAEAPDRDAVIVGDEAERLRAAPAPGGGSAACRGSGARAGPRRESRSCRSGRRAERSRPGGRAAPARPSAGAAAAASRSSAAAGGPTRTDRPGSRARGRPERSRAGTCRPHRTGSSDRCPAPARVTSTSSSPMPSKRRTSPAKRKVSPGVSVSAKYSSISPEHPSARQHRAGPRARGLARAAP